MIKIKIMNVNLLLILLLVVSLAGSAFTQQAPMEVQKMIDGYIQDSTNSFGLKAAQRSLGADRSLKQADIQVGHPIEVYYISEDALDTCGNDLPLQDLLVPANIWTFPVQAHGQYIYYVEIAKRKDGKWHWIESGELKPENWWQKLRKSYPESCGINPILIRHSGFQYLYFPQKSPFNLFSIKYGNESFELAHMWSNSIDSLDDGRRLVPHLKKIWKDTQPFRDAYNKKHPGFFKTKSDQGGGK